MHVSQEAQRHSVAADGSRIIRRERQEPRSALLLRLRQPLMCPYYVRPSVCNVGLLTAEGIAKPESDWNAANTPRVCGPRSQSIVTRNSPAVATGVVRLQ